MSEVITAVYEKGVLRPLRPLNLREQQTVYLQVVPEKMVDEEEGMTAEPELKLRVLAALAATGLVTLPKATMTVRARHTPIEAEGQPASEILIEERRGKL